MREATSPPPQRVVQQIAAASLAGRMNPLTSLAVWRSQSLADSALVMVS